MKLISITLGVLGLAIGINAQFEEYVWPEYAKHTRLCNLTSIDKPVLNAADIKAIDAFVKSPVFSFLRKRELDSFGNEINPPFTCLSYNYCIAPEGKLMCASLGIDVLNSGLFITESGTFGSLRDGKYEFKRRAGLSGGRTTGNFLSGPYNTKTSTTSVIPTTTEACGAAFMIGTKVAAGCLDESQLKSLATKTTATSVPAQTTADACLAAFLIDGKTAAGCVSETGKKTTATGAAILNNKVGLGFMAMGVAGVGLAGF